MRILLATPLYPPEVAAVASYAKELARQLSEAHEVTVLAYAHLPEELEGVTVIPIEKRQSRFARMRAFRRALAEYARAADVVIAINGKSVELPLLLARLPQLVFCIADAAAHEHAGLLERLIRKRAASVLDDVPGPKPEILPLEPEPKAALAAWNASWQTHLATLSHALKP